MAYQSILNPMPVTGGLTDTQLRASAVPVSIGATVTITGALTDTQLRASAVAVSLTSTTVTNSVAITAAALPLPSGASTETTLAALNAKVTTINTGAVTISAALPSGANTIGAVMGTFWQATQPVSAAALPLPTGAATDATLVFTNVNASDLFTLILTELRVISTLLQVGLSIKDEPSDLRDDLTRQLN